MILETFDKEQYENDLIEHAKAEGKAEGRTEGKAELVIELVNDGVLSIAEAAKKLEMTEEELKKML